MGIGMKATWGMGIWGISVGMCRIQKIKMGMRKIELGCSESE